MENKIKEHIDKLLKKRLKESVDSEVDKMKNESAVPLDKNEEKRQSVNKRIVVVW